MKSPESIDWREAHKWADAHGQDSIIIVCRSTDPNLTHVLTWGRTAELSSDASEGGNQIVKVLWPEPVPPNKSPAWLEGLIEVYKAATFWAFSEYGGSNRKLIVAIKKHREAIESKIAK